MTVSPAIHVPFVTLMVAADSKSDREATAATMRRQLEGLPTTAAEAKTFAARKNAQARARREAQDGATHERVETIKAADTALSQERPRTAHRGRIDTPGIYETRNRGHRESPNQAAQYWPCKSPPKTWNSPAQPPQNFAAIAREVYGTPAAAGSDQIISSSPRGGGR